MKDFTNPCRHLLILSPIILFAFSISDKGPVAVNADNSSFDPWARMEKILRRIHEPQFGDKVYRFSDFGGTGDGITDNRQAFEHVIEACHKEGGGKIVVDPGDYLINGPIHLMSNIHLYLEEGVRLFFGDNPDDYLPLVLTSWEGTRVYNYSPFIYGFQLKNVAITGKGEIDGESAETFANWQKLQKEDQVTLRRMNNENIPLDQRIFGEGHFLRPHLIQFYECENILIEGMKITDAPFWCIHFVYCRNITVRSVRFAALNLNNDGIDPESCEDVLIEDIVFHNRDDNIAVKAGRDLEARILKRPSRNIVVRNCRFRGHNAFAVGSEMSGGVYDVFVEDCKYVGKVMYGIYLKGNRDRGGNVHDIYARNLEFDSTRSVIIIDSDYKNEGSCCPPVFRNIRVENITSRYSEDHGICLRGFETAPLDSLILRNINIHEAMIPLELEHVDHLFMEDIWINEENYSYGKDIKVEWSRETSPDTGREVWQITSDSAASVACYFEHQAFACDERYLVFSSLRSGKWSLYRTDLTTGIVAQLTPEERQIFDNDYTVIPGGEKVCYLDGWKLFVTGIENKREEVLFDYTGLLPDQPWFTGSFTNDGKYTLVYVSNDTLKAIYRTCLKSGEILEVHRQQDGTFSHPMINPEDPDVITYVPGPDRQNDMSLSMEQRARTWKIDLRAGTNRQFLTAPYGFRATHESWSFNGERFYFFRKSRPGWVPVAICSMNKEGNDWQIHYESDTIYLGHGSASRDMKWFVSDSQEPGSNELVLVNLEKGEAEVLGYPDATITGGHPAHAHVHPSFSLKGNYICYTSDRNGVPQVYLVPIGDIISKHSN